MYLGLFVQCLSPTGLKCCSPTPGSLSEILGGHTIFKVIVSPSCCYFVGKICWGFSANKGSGIGLSYTKRKKKEPVSFMNDCDEAVKVI